MPTETTTAGREFARRYLNTLCELQLQPGIHRRIERLMEDFAEEHPNLRASYLSREVDERYFPAPDFPPEVLIRPRLHGLAISGEHLYEFLAFAHGLRRETLELHSILSIQETWLEPQADAPFILRVGLFHRFPAATWLLATTGEGQDAAQAFVARLKYLRGW